MLLQQFGAGRTGSSDHCPLWFQLGTSTREPKAMPKQPDILAILRDEESRDIATELNKVPVPMDLEREVATNDMAMTDEFASGKRMRS